MLTRRLQVLIDDDLRDRLSRESQRTGAPVGEVVRRELRRAFGEAGEDRRRQAGRDLLSLADDPADGREPDWTDQKREVRDGRLAE